MLISELLASVLQHASSFAYNSFIRTSVVGILEETCGFEVVAPVGLVDSKTLATETKWVMRGICPNASHENPCHCLAQDIWVMRVNIRILEASAPQDDRHRLLA